MPDYLHTQRISRVLVTTSDGVLIGLLRLEDLDRQRPGAPADSPEHLTPAPSVIEIGSPRH